MIFQTNLQSQTRDLDTVFSDKPLGCSVGEQATTFRLFAPRATAVTLALFAKYNDEKGRDIPMIRDDNGVWEYTERGTPRQFYGKYYGYRIAGASGAQEFFNPDVLVGDPYSKAVVTKNMFQHPTKTLILDTKYDWQGDTWVIPANHNELVIYEAHVRDLTTHPSSGVTARGTYKGLTEKGKKGGLSYLKELGVNAVEFLPLHKFATIELPYKDSSTIKPYRVFNDGNPYERNHWGYMTSYFFAPETYYATDGSVTRGAYNGVDGRAVREMKDMIKALHKEKIAVLLDVVYNHVSDFDRNPFKFIDKMYYFRTDSVGNFINTSYCGNDFKTERKMARRLIIESVKYWMTEYHVDGFRFDLAAMIDRETCEEILREARKINPNVILIAEPWGGNKYNPAGFSDIGWAAWNDQIRNGVKGQNPKDGLGFIFGKHQGSNSKQSERSFINGTLREDGGLFLKKEHSINYLESHDDETLGDFIRIALGDASFTEPLKNLKTHYKLTPKQLALNKLAALFLFSSQGPIMLHSGQEYARSKVIAKTSAHDPNVGKLDRNSYNKDNETNYLNYAHRDQNRELFEYYKGLIALRKKYPAAFGGAAKADISFVEVGKESIVVFRVRNSAAITDHTQPKSFFVLLNGETNYVLQLMLPGGVKRIIANANVVSPEKSLGSADGLLVVPPGTGLILAEESQKAK